VIHLHVYYISVCILSLFPNSDAFSYVCLLSKTFENEPELLPYAYILELLYPKRSTEINHSICGPSEVQIRGLITVAENALLSNSLCEAESSRS